MRTSSTTQASAAGWPWAKKSSAEANTSTRMPAERSRLQSDSRTDASSSTT